MSGSAAIVTLLTDFGVRDSYVGAMKGVLASLAPGVPVVDLCHELPPQDVLRAGLVWCDAVRYFPAGCIHVAVVDPGVGTRRRLLAVEARGSCFLAPDNGLLGLVLARHEVRRIHAITNKSLFLEEVSRTFHGRDIFAPVAARLATGLELGSVGPRLRSYQRIEEPKAHRRSVRINGKAALEERGEVVHIDAFGNAILNLRPLSRRRLIALRIGRLELKRTRTTYGDVAPGGELLLVGSSGRLEIAVNQGNAAVELGIRVGERVTALWST